MSIKVVTDFEYTYAGEWFGGAMAEERARRAWAGYMGAGYVLVQREGTGWGVIDPRFVEKGDVVEVVYAT